LRLFRLFGFPSLLVFAAVSAAGLAAPVSAASSTLQGIDVSHHNNDNSGGTIDWAQVKQDGVRFVIAKATEAADFHDPKYLDNKQQVEAQGLAFTAYHFARPDKTAGDAVAEADFFVASAHLTGANLVPVLDLEDAGGLGIKKLKQWTKAWLGEVQAKLGVKATIYTNSPFWKAKLGDTHWFADNGYRLWIAHWTTANQPNLPAASWSGKGWTMWQYDNCGTVSGITGCVDMDRYNGTGLAALKIKNNR
jgi:GH25 family lysozyme M1 (1,4-beta-N-acetylmuramidase)